MSILAFIGFLAIGIFAVCMTATALVSLVAGFGFSGQVEPHVYVLAAISAALWVVAYYLSPFSIIVKGTT